MVESGRRLVAIMFTDMVGYTALGQRDESLSLALVEEQRRVIRPVLARHNGREVNTMGDAFLVEFPNAVDAVRCAYDIQRAIREFNLSFATEKRIHLRIGVHVGEVIEYQGDIAGDAVNVASRIEPLAEDGGVCVSRQTYDHVRNKIDLSLQSIGPRLLKNVVEPVEVFKMVMPWTSIPETSTPHLNQRRIAVLPFVNVSPDPQDEFFADGLTEELIDKLCKSKDLEVIARTSVMSFKKKAVRAGEIGRDLRVGSLVEGSVRKSGNKVRVTAQLIDAESEGHLWSSTYDRNLEDIFVVQSDIAERVADALRVQLLPSEKSAIERRPTPDSEAYTLSLKGRYYWNERTKESMLKAVSYFERAIEKDPGFAQAYSGLSDAYGVLVNYGHIIPSEGLPKAKGVALKAIALDESLADAHASLAVISWGTWDFPIAGKELRTALRLNPSYARAHLWYGEYLFYMEKKIDDALAEKKKSLELDPLSPIANLNVGAIYYHIREYDKAISEFERALEMFPDFWNLHVWLGTSLHMKGKHEEAVKELKQALLLSGNDASVLSTLGCVYAQSNKIEEAKAVLTELSELSKHQYVTPVNFAYLHASLGDLDRAFAMLDSAIQVKASQVPESLLGDPLFIDALKGDSRYEKVLDQVGLEGFPVNPGSIDTSLSKPIR